METRIAWIDVETTGIEADKNSLLQVACIVTDTNLQELGEGFEAKIYYSNEEVAVMKDNANDFVKKMHTDNGLWDSLSQGYDADNVQRSLLNYLKEHIDEPGTARLAGNSITLDRNFLQKNLPHVLEYLSYRSYDFSTVSGLFDLYVPEVPWQEKKKTHDALDDIRESLVEGRYYIDHLKAYSRMLKKNVTTGKTWEEYFESQEQQAYGD